MTKQSALIAGIIGGGLLLAGCSAPPTAVAPSATNPPEQTTITEDSVSKPEAGPNTLSISSQKNGSSITIDSAALEKQGFVMLLKTDADGNPTDMAGVSEAFTGTKTAIPIELMEKFKSGDKLYAMLHTDANSNGKFEWPGPDEPINDTEGLAIMQLLTLE